MPQPSVDASRHEEMRLRPSGLNFMVEAGSGMQHRYGTNSLADRDQQKAGDKKQAAGIEWRPVAVGKKDGHNDALYEGGRVGDCVSRPVRRQEEAVDGGHGGVPLGRGPEFEEMERRQGQEEEWDAPEGAGGEV